MGKRYQPGRPCCEGCVDPCGECVGFWVDFLATLDDPGSTASFGRPPLHLSAPGGTGRVGWQVVGDPTCSFVGLSAVAVTASAWDTCATPPTQSTVSVPVSYELACEVDPYTSLPTGNLLVTASVCADLAGSPPVSYAPVEQFPSGFGCSGPFLGTSGSGAYVFDRAFGFQVGSDGGSLAIARAVIPLGTFTTPLNLSGSLVPLNAVGTAVFGGSATVTLSE